MGHFYYDFIAAAVAILATKHQSHKPILLILLYKKAYTSVYICTCINTRENLFTL